MTDTHCHLDACEDATAAADPGLNLMVTIGTGPDSNAEAIRLAGEFANVRAAVGIHPNSAGVTADGSAVSLLAEQAAHDSVVGIGETGFDTHWDRATLKEQQFAFDVHAGLALELNKTLILHVRDRQGGRSASAAAFDAIRAASVRGGILHCFGGDAALLEEGLSLGWYVSFAGNLTYPSARRLHEVAREVPEDRLLIETDSPYLTPVPYRGKRNVPANVAWTCAKLAELRGVSTAHMESVTDTNALRAYGIGTLTSLGA